MVLLAAACGEDGAESGPDTDTGREATGTGSSGDATTGGDASTGGASGGTGSGSGTGTGGESDTGPGSDTCLKPNADNTGPSGELVPYDGPTTITEDGATYENFELEGTINIEADDVTLRNFRIDGGHYGINIAGGHSGIVIEDGEILDIASAGILGVGYTARRLYVHDSDGDGLKVQGTGGPTLVESSFIEKLGRGEDAHADGNQTRGGANITFRCNNIFMPYPGTDPYPGEPYKSNATFMLQLEIENFVIEDNWLVGGNYTIYSPGGVSVRNNRFGRHNGGWPDKVEARIKNGTFDAWSGNVWEDTGDPVD